MIGPLLIAIAVWCAAGTLTVASPDAAALRLAVPAPWWVLPLAGIAATLVPGWRRRPLAAAPALLSTMPWWPVPLPAIALLFTGPLAWLPIAISLAAAIGAPRLAARERTPGHRAGRSMVLAACATIAVSALIAWHLDARVPGGDEPHYLVITQSLLQDGDIQIENNHRQRDYAAYFGGTLNPDYAARGVNGEIYSIHAPGLPLLILPAFAAAGYRGAEIWLVILAGLTGALLWRIGWEMTREAAAAWFAWASVAGSASFLLQSFTVFPDAPGAFATATAILLIVRMARGRERVGWGAIAATSLCIAALPWLHTRFSVLAGGLGAVAALQLLSDESRAMRARASRAALFLAAPVASAIGWFAFFRIVYGTFNPAAPYGGAAGTRLAYVPGGLTGLLFDEQFGLLVYAPVLAVSVVGLFQRVDRPFRFAMRGAFAAGAAYLVAVATYWLWWAGVPAGPARFAVAALPAAAAPLALLWQRSDATARRMWLALLVGTLAISAVTLGVSHGDLTWNMRNAEALWLDWLGPVVNLPRAWPSFFWQLDPSQLRTEWPFVVHVAAWLAIVWGALASVTMLARSRQWSGETTRLAIGASVLAALMLAVQTGWWLNGAEPLDAARSQMAVLGAPSPAWAIGPAHVERGARLPGRIRIRNEEPGRTDGPAPWFSTEWVPAGTYGLRMTSSRPRAGSLNVFVGRSDAPITTIPVQAVSRQSTTLVLPVGAAWLTIAPSADLDGVSGGIQLEPQQVRLDRGFARGMTTYGTTRVFFLDQKAAAEPTGFWVPGGETTEIAIGSPDPAAAIALRNGPRPNEVTVETAAVERLSMAPSEVRQVRITGANEAPIRVRITPASGFRPSDDGTSEDSRYLGVWIEVP